MASAFTDYYAQQSCTAGRAAFIGGSVPVRSGMTKVGLPGSKEGWQKTDVTMATVLKAQGYATGQFGKNHQGDLDEHLPTMHGFDEFLGNLYHLNAEEEPENFDYPKNPEFRKKFGPRGVIRAKADGKGGQTVEDTGPLTKKRMETIDDETVAARQGIHHARSEVRHAVLRVVERHADAFPHPRQGGKSRQVGTGRVRRRHGRTRHACRRIAQADRRSRCRRQYRGHVFDRQRPAFQRLAGCGHHAVPQREEHELGRRLPRSCLRSLARPHSRGHDAEWHRRA